MNERILITGALSDLEVRPVLGVNETMAALVQNHLLDPDLV